MPWWAWLLAIMLAAVFLRAPMLLGRHLGRYKPIPGRHTSAGLAVAALAAAPAVAAIDAGSMSLEDELSVRPAGQVAADVGGWISGPSLPLEMTRGYWFRGNPAPELELELTGDLAAFSNRGNPVLPAGPVATAAAAARIRGAPGVPWDDWDEAAQAARAEGADPARPALPPEGFSICAARLRAEILLYHFHRSAIRLLGNGL